MPELSELKTFSADTIKDLSSAIRGDLIEMFDEWWTTNRTSMKGYIKSLARSVTETQRNLASGKISDELADIALQAQKAALRQFVRHTKLMTLVLLQQVVNTIFRRIGWLIFNKTGVNFFPELVST
ncbi:hypothetical protein [Roseovarius sp. EL26]|uniref:hypothetical protein n=1 Tax=Roseovarius sp. EL26 TaxID=2126672 RepID=UPI000EA39EA8|nr:hypothetical protein [Roseovarius sp. EL26]